MSRRRSAWVLLAFVAAGCAVGREASVVAPPTPATRYVPPADRYVRSVLLDFESPVDETFVDAADKRVRADPTLAANRVLATEGTASIRLGALVRGRAFPGAWDLVGVRLATVVASRCAVAVDEGDAKIADATVPLSPDRWRTVWLNLAALRGATRPTTAAASEVALSLRVAPPSGVGVMIDEVVLAQSRIVVADTRSPRTNEAFRVARAATTWRATLGDRTLLELPAAPFAEGGYRVADACAARVVFRESSGDVVCVDRLGRVTRADEAGTTSAARIAIVDGPARVDRDRPGDRDNDGFDESLGCYAIRATGGRLTFRIDGSATTPTAWPTVDVSGLPAGEVSVWVEGQLVANVTRAGDGRATIELPLDVQRPVDVQVRVRE